MDDGVKIESLVADAMSFLMDYLGAERAMVAHHDGHHPDPVIQSSRGFQADITWSTDELSRHMLERLADEAHSLQEDNILPARGRSTLTAPLRNRSGNLVGFLYADRLQEKGAYGAGELQDMEGFSRDYVRTLMLRLTGEHLPPPTPVPEPKPQAPPLTLHDDPNLPVHFPEAGMLAPLEGPSKRMFVDWT